MRNRVERLRLWLLAGAVVLVLVLAAFIGVARYWTHHFLAKLPAKLGVDIRSETNGFTYSQSLQGKTIYTIHAAKELEHRDGKITLHDVRMVLYGKKGDRADAITGDEFEYDQSAGMVRAIGPVHIDLKAADAAAVARADRPGKAKEHARETGSGEAKILHATTSGLIYMDKLGVAATSEPIEFELGGMTGHAVGADYNSDTGVLLLHSAVNMSGVTGKRPMTLTAAAAELDTRDQRALLTSAKYRTGANNSEGKTATAEHATLHRRADGSLERIEAQGNVMSEGPSGRVVSQRADVMLNEQSQPKSAVLTGGVVYSLDGPLQQRQGQAAAANISFDAEGRASHAVFTGAVRMTEKTRATDAAKEPWSVRDLTAAKVDAGLVAVDGHRSELREIDATGGARLTVVKSGSLASAKGKGTTELAADDLKAHLIGAGGAKRQPELDTISGRGHTSLHQVNADGKEQMSAGDSLEAKFRPGVGGARLNGEGGGRQVSDSLQNSVQVGHVTMMQRTPAKAGAKTSAPDVENASAERAVYDGDADRMTLTGGVQLRDAGSLIWANQVTLDHKTSDVLAEGAVKVNYVREDDPKASAGSAEPTHILADRAGFIHATKVATFYGAPVRLWQGGSQVQAPVIEFSRADKRVVARGVAGRTGSQVHTVLVGADRTKTGAAKPAAGKRAKGIFGSAKAGAAAGSPNLARIASGELVYSGMTHQADFTGGVRVESQDGTMLAREAVVYLTTPNGDAPASGVSANAAGGDLALNGRVDRVVATGHIELEQPEQRATGEKLVYTASDELLVLTGDKDAPPKVVDTVQGTTVTGAALLFHLDDQGVEALSTVPGEKSSGQRVRTDAQVNGEMRSGPEGKAGKAKH